MAAPTKDNATSSAQAPGNGNAWETLHGNPTSGGAATSRPDLDAVEETADGAEDDKAKDDAASVASASKEGAAASEVPEGDPELVDAAVLEAEAEAIVDDAAEEAHAETSSDAAQKEAAEWKDKYVRLHAEWDTYRRRQKEQAKEQKALAAEKLVSSLIPVIDDLERSIDYAKKNGETGLLGGVEAVLAKFVDTLEKDGVVVIDPKGEPFEALEAQAVGTVDDASQPEETVADVYQRGYKMGRKVLRPAMVTITTGGPRREKKDEDE